MKYDKYLVIIPARGGSKGIPKKNIQDLGGLPLIAHTIEAAKKIFNPKNIIVSTDSNKIAAIAKQFGATVPYLRPKEISQDNSSSIDLINDLLEKFSDFENLVLLQPTSPLRQSHHIVEAIDVFEDTLSNSLISVKEINFNPNYFFRHNNSYLSIDKTIKHSSRQDSEKRVYPNGAIYITSKKSLLKHQSFFSKKTAFYVMDKISSIDIDDLDDLKLANCLINYNE